MSSLIRKSDPRGVTLVECAVALVVSSVLLTAVYALLLAGWRTARASSVSIEVRQNVRAAAAALRAELLGVSAPAGDLLQLSDSALALRATRSVGFVCANPVGGTILLGDSLMSATRAVDPARDSVLIFREGDSLSSDDDRWLHAGISSLHGGACSDGTSATALALTGLTASDLAGVSAGAPARTFEILEYRRYADADRIGWLGVRGPAAGGGWVATSPIAGPLRARDGIVFRFTGRDARATGVPADVALIDATVHGLDERLLVAPGRPLRPSADSATIRVFVGGP